jgi:tetratricopeptide (TPR) repeat protein
VDKGKYDAALADLDEVVRLDPRDARAYDVRGTARLSKGDNAAAIADYDRSIGIDPGYTPACRFVLMSGPENRQALQIPARMSR